MTDHDRDDCAICALHDHVDQRNDRRRQETSAQRDARVGVITKAQADEVDGTTEETAYDAKWCEVERLLDTGREEEAVAMGRSLAAAPPASARRSRVMGPVMSRVVDRLLPRLDQLSPEAAGDATDRAEVNARAAAVGLRRALCETDRELNLRIAVARAGRPGQQSLRSREAARLYEHANALIALSSMFSAEDIEAVIADLAEQRGILAARYAARPHEGDREVRAYDAIVTAIRAVAE